MTQTSAGLKLRLTSMRRPDAIPVQDPAADQRLSAYASERMGAAEAHDLLVHPGERGELVLQVQNIGSQPQTLRLEVRGDFPSEWCRWSLEGSVLIPGQEMWIGIYVDIPAHFFEGFGADESWGTATTDHSQDPATEAVTQEPEPPSGSSLRQQPFKIDHRASIHLYYSTPGQGVEQRQVIPFQFFIRPHSLYLRFLPQLYREVDFVGRLLHIFEQALEPSVWALEGMWAYLDPNTAPVALLPFLSHWVGWQMPDYLDLPTQRRLIRQAVELYRWRGTRRGLRLYLHLFTGLPLDDHIPSEHDKHICIQEPFGPGFVLGDTRLGYETLLGGGQAYHFSVILRPLPHISLDRKLIDKIIEQEKPAFCTYDLTLLDPDPAPDA